ncbi:hypothetical protein BpHYR1_000789 [Brachionus plicatilis]|uniref:Uncharacterized protein n=1 Tax=Brachionus plicatilis TaxID=10195 RepID=A0A3M7SW13_BRAPC|nr:hypothetical protein BpHYR1_000789 [Brachionus plicatilis]
MFRKLKFMRSVLAITLKTQCDYNLIMIIKDKTKLIIKTYPKNKYHNELRQTWEINSISGRTVSNSTHVLRSKSLISMTYPVNGDPPLSSGAFHQIFISSALMSVTIGSIGEPGLSNTLTLTLQVSRP